VGKEKKRIISVDSATTSSEFGIFFRCGNDMAFKRLYYSALLNGKVILIICVVNTNGCIFLFWLRIFSRIGNIKPKLYEKFHCFNLDIDVFDIVLIFISK
jgi:hypothetical protein